MRFRRAPVQDRPITPRALPGALILGGAHGSLAVARSLGRHGVPVFFLTHDHPITRFSRYTSQHATWAGPDDPGALDELLRLARSGLNGWVLIPSGDLEVRFVAQHHDELARAFRLTTPTWDIVQWAGDKRLTYRLAADLEIPHPRTFFPKDRADLATIDFAFPLILKPTMRDQPNAFTRAKAWRVDSAEELLARYDEAAALVAREAISVQELIPGSGTAQYSFAALCRDGVPIATLVARRNRQYPIEFGFTSTCVETVHEPEVERLAKQFLQALRYDGLAELEFKLDRRDNQFKLLDFNARPWTWIALGAAADVDFAWMMWQTAIGEPVAERHGTPGRVWMHVSRDLVAACHEILISRIKVSEFIRTWRLPLSFAAFAKDDPLPGIVDLLLSARPLLRYARGLIGGKSATVTPPPAGNATPKHVH
jgi:predicted ATP-grasp superfamily ATP-dependent carboligase